MVTIDSLEKKIEKLTDQVRGLNFSFNNSELQQDAEHARDEAIDLLDRYLELAAQDWEERPQNDSADQDEDE